VRQPHYLRVVRTRLRTTTGPGAHNVDGSSRGPQFAPSAFIAAWRRVVTVLRGAPDIPANSPAAYYPGDAYVDWVGTDFYSKFPNFTGLEAFYKQYPQKPFAFGEWAIWGGENPSFVSQLFTWVNTHTRVRMMLYNQGIFGPATSPFQLSQYPRRQPPSSAPNSHPHASSPQVALGRHGARSAPSSVAETAGVGWRSGLRR
jgi:hypothetical protein